MNLLALLLAIAGTAALCAVVPRWRGRGSNEAWVPETVLCEAPSPDNNLLCDQEVGHYAWHRCDGSEWFGDNWAVDEWADTMEWPVIVIQDEPTVETEPTMAAAAWAATERKPGGQPWTKLYRRPAGTPTKWQIAAYPPSPGTRTPEEKHFDKLMRLRTIAQVEELLREERREHLANLALGAASKRTADAGGVQR